MGEEDGVRGEATRGGTRVEKHDGRQGRALALLGAVFINKALSSCTPW